MTRDQIKKFTVLLVQNLKTGELLRDTVCADANPQTGYVSCGRGTYRLSNGKHVCEPLVIVGRVEVLTS